MPECMPVRREHRAYPLEKLLVRAPECLPLNPEAFLDAHCGMTSIPCSPTVILMRALNLLSRRPMAL